MPSSALQRPAQGGSSKSRAELDPMFSQPMATLVAYGLLALAVAAIIAAVILNTRMQHRSGVCIGADVLAVGIVFTALSFPSTFLQDRRNPQALEEINGAAEGLAGGAIIAVIGAVILIASCFLK